MKEFKQFLSEVTILSEARISQRNFLTKEQSKFFLSKRYLSGLGLELARKDDKNPDRITVTVMAPDGIVGRRAFAEIKKDLGEHQNVSLRLTGLDDAIELVFHFRKLTKAGAKFLVSKKYLSDLGLELWSKKNTQGSGTMEVQLRAPGRRVGKRAFAAIEKKLADYMNVSMELAGLDNHITVKIGPARR